MTRLKADVTRPEDGGEEGAGSLAGIVGTYGAGVILDATGSWNAVLGVTAGVYALGAAVWLAFSTGERVFD